MRVVVDGTWGFASHVELTPERAAATAERAVASPARWRHWPGNGSSAPASRCTPGSNGVGLHDRPVTVPTGEKVAVLTDWSRRLLAARGGPRRAGVAMVRENKYYADLAGTSTLQQRVRTAPSIAATTVDRDGGGFETMGSLAPPRRRGWEYLTGTGWDLDDRAGPAARAAGREGRRPVGRARPVRPGDRPDQPVADHPRVGGARHRVRPGHRLRGRLRRHQFRHARPARHPALRLAAHARHRGPDVPHGLATIGFDDDGVATGGGTWCATGCWSATSWTARSPPPGALPQQRLRLRRLPAPRADPADGQRLAATRPGRRHQHRRADRRRRHGIYVVGDKSWSIDMQRYNFQFTGQRFYRSRTAGWPGSCATSPTRRPPPTSGDRWTAWAGRRPGCCTAR